MLSWSADVNVHAGSGHETILDVLDFSSLNDEGCSLLDPFLRGLLWGSDWRHDRLKAGRAICATME
jgi:hypothetical protein